jgi:flagellar basal-body rod protein FlgB
MSGIDFNAQVLLKAMDLRLKKHASIAGNIANADTPGYRPKAVSFESELQKLVQSGDQRNLQRIEGRVHTVDDKIPRLDGNTVSLDRQMAAMTENTTIYSATAEFLKKKISMIKKAIS